MKIDLPEVRRIATLACLEFEESELARFAGQMSSILTYMECLDHLDTSGVEPTFHSITHASPLRQDLVRPGLAREEATRGAPRPSGRSDAHTSPEGGQFLVPRVIG